VSVGYREIKRVSKSCREYILVTFIHIFRDFQRLSETFRDFQRLSETFRESKRANQAYRNEYKRAGKVSENKNIEAEGERQSGLKKVTPNKCHI